MPRGGRVLANGAGVKLAVIISSDGWLWDSTCLLCVPGFRTLKRPPFQTLDGLHYPSKMLSTRLAQQSEISSAVTGMLSSTHEATSEATAAAADCAR